MWLSFSFHTNYDPEFEVLVLGYGLSLGLVLVLTLALVWVGFGVWCFGLGYWVVFRFRLMDCVQGWVCV